MQDQKNSTISNGWDESAVRETAEALKGVDGPLLPILHALCERFGYIDDRAIPVVADVLNWSRADVHGVVSFYNDFRREPAGRHVVKVCRAEACQSMGSDGFVDRLEKAFGIACGETTPDGRVTLEVVYCLGNCALSPSALIDGRLYGRMDVDRTVALVGRGAR
ncbi:MAG: NAD(P)H-dependent oxidoreductase subunit E [Dongiaceae bacterium]